MQKNVIDIIFFTPEMFFGNNYTSASSNSHPFCQQVKQFQDNYQPSSARDTTWDYIPLLVIDEVHEISESGFEYRPAFRKMWAELSNHFWVNNAAKLALSATINQRVANEIISVLPNMFDHTVVDTVYRSNIHIRVVLGCSNRNVRLKWVHDHIRACPVNENFLIFVHSRAECDVYANCLHGIEGNVRVHHSGLEKSTRVGIEEDFKKGKFRILVATKGIGTGYDKADIHSVIHTYTPPTPVQYYQEIGRSGRNRSITANAYLLPSTPWRTDSWVNALTHIVRLLEGMSTKSTSLEHVRGVLESKNIKKQDIDKAIEVALVEEIAVTNENNLNLRLDWKPRFNLLERHKIAMKEEIIAMKSINANNSCPWRSLQLCFSLGQNADWNEWSCGRCSYCDKSVGFTEADPFEMSTRYWKQTTPKLEVDVYSFFAPNETMDLDHIRNVCDEVLEGVAVVPANWILVPVPSTNSDVLKNANSLGTELAMDIVNCFSLDSNKKERKMVNANTNATQAQVLEKYILNENILIQQYGGIGNILLYDDCIRNGATIDYLVSLLRQQKYDGTIVAVTNTFFGSPEEHSLRNTI